MASDDTSPGVSPKIQKQKGVSRKKKSASQTEVLERAYALEKYPSESTRTVLSRELDLSEKQLQIWFTHRRYKDRRDGVDDEKLMANSRRSKLEPGSSSKKGKTLDFNSREEDDSEDGYPAAQVLAEEHYDEDLIADYNRNGLDKIYGGYEEELDVKPKPKPSPRRSRSERIVRDLSQAEVAATIVAQVENQLGGPVRNDGPPLGFEFDPLPPDAFQQLAMTV